MRGINVIGHLRSISGLGNTARLFSEVLRKNGCEVAELDIDAAFGNDETLQATDGRFLSSVSELPHDNNLIIATVTRLPQLWLRHLKGLSAPRFRNAGMLFWELPVIPSAWLPSWQMFDVVLTPTSYVRQAFESAIPDMPTVPVEHPLPAIPDLGDREARRKAYGIPSVRTVFCSGFDPRSGLARKNPLAVLEAFQRAFPDDDDVCLVVKTNGEIHDWTGAEEAAEIAKVVAKDRRILVFTQRLTHGELLRFFDCCDVFVSLHRSEGLGLVPMEAMALGKLVIATGYSGNMSYMSEQNSIPISYRLVRPARDVPNFGPRFSGKGAFWAEPDIDHAARALRSATDPDLRSLLGERARRDIRERQEVAWAGRFIEPMLDHLARSGRPARRASIRRRILLQEVADPTLRKKNLKVILGMKR